MAKKQQLLKLTKLESITIRALWAEYQRSMERAERVKDEGILVILNGRTGGVLPRDIEVVTDQRGQAAALSWGGEPEGGDGEEREHDHAAPAAAAPSNGSGAAADLKDEDPEPEDEPSADAAPPSPELPPPLPSPEPELAGFPAATT